MGPYLTSPKKDKDSENGENQRVNIIIFSLIELFEAKKVNNTCEYRLNMEQQECKVGEIQWRTPTSLH